MHSLVVHFGPSQLVWTFTYKEFKHAKAAYDILCGSTKAAEINDDFGQIAVFNVADIHGVLLDDMDASAEAWIERGLYTARTNARCNLLAQQDPKLKVAAMTGAMPMRN